MTNPGPPLPKIEEVSLEKLVIWICLRGGIAAGSCLVLGRLLVFVRWLIGSICLILARRLGVLLRFSAVLSAI